MYAVEPPDPAGADAAHKRGMQLLTERNELGRDAEPRRLPRGIDFDPATGSPRWWELHRQALATLKEADALRGYFRLNISGMGWACDRMHALGMLVEAGHGAYPKAESFGVTEDERDDDDPDDDAPKNERVAAWRAAVLAWQTDHGQGGPGIPGHKFGTNDGWVVTPDEIRAALATLATQAPERVAEVVGPEHPDLWARWVAYLTEMTERGGFRVY